MQSSRPPFRHFLPGVIALACLLTGLSGGFTYSHVAHAAGPAISKATRSPAGYVVASDQVSIQFEATAGSSGQVLYTTNNWSTSATIAATKIGTDGGNDVLVDR
jgi:hypothetical protein